MSKVMVSLPDDLLAEIDEEARRRSTNRSAFLATAARRELTRGAPEAIEAAIARSVDRFRRSRPFESAEVVRATRDARE
jgi:metal-responsive CopG/Arc/MetJ family transcriptional regulator